MREPRWTEVGMHEESGRPPLRGGCHPIERNDVGGGRIAEPRAAAPLLAATGVRIELLDGFACYAPRNGRRSCTQRATAPRVRSRYRAAVQAAEPS